MDTHTTPTPGMTATTVTVVDRYDLVSGLIHHVLTEHGYTCHLISLLDVSSLDDLIARIVSTQPDLVVCGLELLELGGDSLPTRLCSNGLRVLTLSDSTSPVRHGEALYRGATAVLAKETTTADKFLSTVQAIINGEPVLNEHQRNRLIGLYHARGSASPVDKLARLSRQEREVLGRLSMGQSVRQITRARSCSEATIRTQVKSILAKLEVSSQIQAVALAHQVDWRALPQKGRDGQPRR